MAGVLHKLLHTYTDTAISVTTGLVTSITRFAVQVSVCAWSTIWLAWRHLPFIRRTQPCKSANALELPEQKGGMQYAM